MSEGWSVSQKEAIRKLFEKKSVELMHCFEKDIHTFLLNQKRVANDFVRECEFLAITKGTEQ